MRNKFDINISMMYNNKVKSIQNYFRGKPYAFRPFFFITPYEQRTGSFKYCAEKVQVFLNALPRIH